MPWLSIIMAIIGFLSSLKKNPENKAKAVATGALAGLATYYVSHETEWGQENLGSMDGVVPTTAGTTATLVKDAAGNVVTTTDRNGATVPVVAPTITPATPAAQAGFWDTMTSWGPSGVATVVGTTAVATNSSLQKYLPWILAGAAILLLRK